jgi:serine/threonine protein kinase
VDELRPGFEVTPTVTLLRPLGQGGMGKVWVAEHAGLKTQVVVKFMAKEVEEHADAAERFAREASVAAAVKSPHVAQVFDYGTSKDGTPYIVMELLEGRDLAEQLGTGGPMSPRDVGALVAQVAKALGKAHQVGVIHRDIKPDNIFLCDQEGGELFVKLLDFGIAKHHHQVMSSATTTGQVVGTPYYMSPEQIVGEKNIDARSDLWSLGVVAFEALTGKRPFDGMTVGAITLAIHTKKPKPSDHIANATPALDAWFAKACAQDPADRFASARDLSQALLDAIGDAAPSGAMLRAPMISSPSLEHGDASDPALAKGVVANERAVTSLSSAFPVSRPARAPSKALLFGSVAAVLLLGVLAVFGLRNTADTRASVGGEQPTATPPPSVAAAEPLPSAAVPSATAAEPVVPAETASAVASAAPGTSADTSKPSPRTMSPASRTGTGRSTGTSRVKKPFNDDDIK